MAQTLRRYQIEAAQAVLNAIDPFGEGLNRVLYVAPTGSGKTTMLSEIIRLLMTSEQQHRVLVLAHRIELIEQAVTRITDHCKGLLKSWEIGSEANVWRASPRSRVIVGMVQTCCKPGRPTPQWKPTVIIVDESQHAAAKAHYQRIFDRYGVNEGKCVLIGTTATAKRTDRASLYAQMPDGSPVMIAPGKGKPPVPAKAEQSVFERLVFDYPVVNAVEDGWIVNPRGFVCPTDTSLEGVDTRAGDFVDGQLEKVVNNDRRTNQAISRWKEIAADRPTLVFCAGVEHAARAAALWRSAGYTAEDVNGETDKAVRRDIFSRFRRGELQVITNCGVATEGVDLPNCSCVVMLRPSKSWGLVMQCIGRGSRTLDGLLNGMEDATAEERKAKIAASTKQDSIVLDVVDITKQFNELCTLPKILDLPCNLDLEGHSVVEAKKLMDEHESAKEIVTESLPLTFTELAGRLIAVDLLRSSNARSKRQWKVMDGATLRYEGAPPGFEAKMYQHSNRWQLIVRRGSEILLDRMGKPIDAICNGDANAAMTVYLDKAAQHTAATIDEWRDSQPRGTLEKLTEKQRKCLQANGHTADEINKMPYGYCKKLIGQYMERWNKVRA